MRAPDGSTKTHVLRWPYLLQLAVRYLGVDRAVAFGALSRVWVLVAGPVTLLLIATHFTKELQGYYYTFYSLLALTSFLELGLGLVIQQFASHEWAGLALDAQGKIIGDPAALSRLAGLARMSFRWFGVAGALAAFGIGLVGYVFFSQDPSPNIHWTAAWTFLCVFSGMNLLLLPAWSLLDGCNQMSETNRIRFAVGAVSSGVTWLAILLGTGLWTAPAASASGLCFTGSLMLKRYWNFFMSLRSKATQVISWRREVWPMQWRIALTWVSGYFVYAICTPIIFRENGPVAAGQFGMTWAIINALLTATLPWVNTKAPRFGMLIAERRYADLDSLFETATLQMLMVGIAGAGIIIGGVYALNVMAIPLHERLLDPLTTAVLVLGVVFNMAAAAMAVYLRAHKREPYLFPSLVCGLATGGLTVLVVRRFGTMGVAVSISMLQGLFLIPATVIFLRCRRVWHKRESASSG